MSPSLIYSSFYFPLRWRACSGLTQILFPQATSHLYLKSFTEYDRHQMVLKVNILSVIPMKYLNLRRKLSSFQIGILESLCWHLLNHPSS